MRISRDASHGEHAPGGNPYKQSMKLLHSTRTKLAAMAVTATSGLLASAAKADEIADLVTAATTAATAYKTIGAVVLSVVIFGVVIKYTKRAGSKA